LGNKLSFFLYDCFLFILFRLADDTHAALLSLGAENVNDLWQVYDDVQMLDTLRNLIPEDEYKKFVSSRVLTPMLNPSTQPDVTTPAVNASTNMQIPQDPEQLERSVDVRNTSNSIDRWTLALSMYSQQKHPAADNHPTDSEADPAIITPSVFHRADGKVIINALIDISGSMAGTKLIAVKLGLCALISQLEDNDIMNITSFSDRSQTITGGFQTVGQLKEFLPYLLFNLRDDGSTAFFNAVIEGIRHLRNYSQGKLVQFQLANLNNNNRSSFRHGNNNPPPANVPVIPTTSVTLTPEENQKVILMALTDGEDNASRYTSVQVLYRLAHPGVDNFMFILLAVDMALREEQTFRSWMELRYCKQISVNIRSGSKLVQIFKEVLIQRILQSDVSQGRFYRLADDEAEEDDGGDGENDGQTPPANPPVPIDYDQEDQDLLNNRNNTRPLDEGQVFQVLRADLLRQHNTNNTNNNNYNIGEDGQMLLDDDDARAYSPAVSRCNSECDISYAPSYQIDPLHRAMTPDGNTSPVYRPTSPAYQYDDIINDVDFDVGGGRYSPMGSYDPDRDDAFVMERAVTPPMGPMTTTTTSGGTWRIVRSRSNSGEDSLTEDISHLVGRPIVVDEVANQGQFNTSSSFQAANQAPLPLPTPPPLPHVHSSSSDLVALPAECYCPITVSLSSLLACSSHLLILLLFFD
jgi:hypothetical protein